MDKKITTICYFGIYDPDYSRNKILIGGLRANGAVVMECNDRTHGWRKYLNLIKKHRSLKGQYDVMFVGYPGFQSMILARFLTAKPIIFDAFYSFYNTMVEDRKVVGTASWLGWYYQLLDWLSCTLADKVIIDTNAHIDYFVNKYKINREKFNRVWIGADEHIFFPRHAVGTGEHSDFILEFHGTFIPLQGLEYIIGAMEILKDENIKLNIIGKGQEFDKIKKMIGDRDLSDKVILLGPKPISELPELIAAADLCLGIFGDTPKTVMVIPNKVYECIAMDIPVVTSDTPAIRELFNEESLMLCRYADSKHLAEKILLLKDNPQLRRRLAANAFKIYQEQLTSKIISNNLLLIINDLYDKQK